MKILIIEDDSGIRSFVNRGLKEAGFTVDATENGEDGYSLLISGSMMPQWWISCFPVWTGYRLLKRHGKEE